MRQETALLPLDQIPCCFKRWNMAQIKEPPSASPNTLFICHLCMKTVSTFSGFGICFLLLSAPEKKVTSHYASNSTKHSVQLWELVGGESAASEVFYWFEAWINRRMKKYTFVAFNYNYEIINCEITAILQNWKHTHEEVEFLGEVFV